MCPYVNPEKRRAYNRTRMRRKRKGDPTYREKERQYRRRYYREHKNEELAKFKEYRKNPTVKKHYAELMQKWRKEHKQRWLEITRQSYHRCMKDPLKRQKHRECGLSTYYTLKQEVLLHYCKDNILKCACCGDRDERFLTLDHRYNDGAEERRKHGKMSGTALYQFVKKMGFPDRYEVLCWTCNCGKAINGGFCPHRDNEALRLQLNQFYDKFYKMGHSIEEAKASSNV